MGYSLAVAAEVCSADYPSGSAAVPASCPEKNSEPAAIAEDASCLACQAAAAEAFDVVQPAVLPVTVAEPSS